MTFSDCMYQCCKCCQCIYAEIWSWDGHYRLKLLVRVRVGFALENAEGRRFIDRARALKLLYVPVPEKKPKPLT